MRSRATFPVEQLSQVQAPGLLAGRRAVRRRGDRPLAPLGQGRQGTRQAFLRPGRRGGGEGPAVALEPPGRGHLRHVRAVRADGAQACEQILGGEVYHYHSKMILKDAKVGGAWTWHQDYGYWYQNGVLFPDLISVFIAVDPCTKENGCLQVIEGSHHWAGSTTS